jgi:NAD(P)-dependent dehydrogenase (short-subunit alcohol dehydrogenase family)
MVPTDIRPTPADACVPGRFAGRTLLVTGAAIGSIGGCTAIRAAREGARVACVDRKMTATHATVAEIEAAGGEAIALIADVGRPEEADRMVADTVARFGGTRSLPIPRPETSGGARAEPLALCGQLRPI